MFIYNFDFFQIILHYFQCLARSRNALTVSFVEMHFAVAPFTCLRYIIFEGSRTDERFGRLKEGDVPTFRIGKASFSNFKLTFLACLGILLIGTDESLQGAIL